MFQPTRIQPSKWTAGALGQQHCSRSPCCQMVRELTTTVLVAGACGHLRRHHCRLGRAHGGVPAAAAGPHLPGACAGVPPHRPPPCHVCRLRWPDHCLGAAGRPAPGAVSIPCRPSEYRSCVYLACFPVAVRSVENCCALIALQAATLLASPLTPLQCMESRGLPEWLSHAKIHPEGGEADCWLRMQLLNAGHAPCRRALVRSATAGGRALVPRRLLHHSC